MKNLVMSEEERRKQFLLELRELTMKHGISIGGCGCCGSPYLDTDVDVSDSRAGYVYGNGSELEWLAPSDGNWWEINSEDVVLPEDGEQE